MKKIILLILINAYAFISISQSTRYFEKHLGRLAPIGENTMWVGQLINGNYVTLGLSDNGSGIGTGLFMKVDAYGNMYMDSNYIDSANVSIFWDAVFENDSTLVMAGEHRLGNSATNEKMSIIKADTSGNIIWSSLVGDSVLPTIGYCIKKTLDGGDDSA